MQSKPCIGRLTTVLMMACVVLWPLNVASSQIRVATYNVAELNGDPSKLQEVLDEISLDDSHGFAADLGVIVFQEVNSDMIDTLHGMFGPQYTRGTYSNQGETTFGGAQFMIYRADLLFEDTSEHKDIYTGAGRYTDRWKLDLLGYDNPQVSFYIYSAHLKSGSSSQNKADRNFGAEQIRADADALPANSNIIYAGDWNLSSYTEDAYATFIAAGATQAVDPYGNGTWSGSSNALKHTQSPRQSTAGGLIGGGMDDRFDFLLLNPKTSDGDGLDWIPGTYRPLGNDGQHYDVAIDSGSNSYFPGDTTRSNLLAQALHDSSDHLPVILDLQVPAIAFLFATNNDPVVIQGGLATVTAIAANQVGVSVPEGAAALQCQVSGGGALAGRGTITDPALGGFGTYTLSFDTSTPGQANGSVLITPTGDEVQGSAYSQSVSTTVLRPAAPSFDATSQILELTIDVPVMPGTGVYEVEVDIFNVGYDSGQALLDVDAITGLAGPVSLIDAPVSPISSTFGTVTFGIDSASIASGGVESVQVNIATSDEDLPGQSTTNLAVTLEIRDENVQPCTADFLPPGGDGLVNLFDFSGLLVAFGTSDPIYDIAPPGGDGVVNTQDFSEFLIQWGPCQ